MPIPEGLVYALANTLKNSATLAEIRHLFVLGGAQPDWQDRAPLGGSQREEATKQWIRGIEARAPGQLDRIVGAVVEALLDRRDVSDNDKKLLRSQSTLAKLGARIAEGPDEIEYPTHVDRLLDTLIRHFRRAERPLSTGRRPGKPVLKLEDEYDVQDFLHALLRVWFKDVRTEEWTPSYAGKTSRIDLLLPEYRIAIETKIARDAGHARRLSEELEIDIGHYIAHPSVHQLWLVVFDPSNHIGNPRALRDLSGLRTNKDATITVKSYVVGGHHSPAVLNE